MDAWMCGRMDGQTVFGSPQCMTKPTYSTEVLIHGEEWLVKSHRGPDVNVERGRQSGKRGEY